MFGTKRIDECQRHVGETSGFKETEMKSFATKVRYGSGPQFDPLSEKRRGWISGEAQRHDVEMADAVIEVMVETSTHISWSGL